MKIKYSEPTLEFLEFYQDVLLISDITEIINGDGAKDDPWGNSDIEY